MDTSGVLIGKTLTQISVGGAFWACALDASGAAYCWGDNGDNLYYLGNGSTASQSNVPVQVGPSPPTGVTAVPGHRAATVSWTAPAMPGEGVTSYTAFASPGEEICITRSTA